MKIRNLFTSLILFFVISSFLLNAQVKHPEWSYNKTIYEVNIRQYTPEGTFNAFKKHLPELKQMGVGILWLMPINPIGEKNRKGSLGSYYSVKDYLKVNPEFGTFDDFKSLVNEVHENGMYIIIDWVANHTSWDNPLVNEHPDWFTKDSVGNFVLPIPEWTDVIDLNYDNKDLWEWMTDALSYWVKECNIDGYRCDVAGMMPTEFWLQARPKLNKIKPVFMLAEWETVEMHKAFDMTYSWDLYRITNDIAKEKADAEKITKYFDSVETKYPKSAFRMRFTSNHDENTWNGTEFDRLGDAAETFVVFDAIIPGMLLIYNGQEAGNQKRLEFFEKDPIKWGKDHKFRSLYTNLIKLKKDNKALWNGEKGGAISFLKNDKDKEVLSFLREKNGNKVVGIFNLTEDDVDVNIEGKGLKGNYKNFADDEKTNISDKITLTLKPWEYKVYYK
ncbi:MAG TPA: alpha-amylase family glycosyl hydrolase [Ignavibacteriaceae bacterium]|nr:alpha-amylase family glycosyl hydrolase [Ignavibacteriaceae bacterium]